MLQTHCQSTYSHRHICTQTHVYAYTSHSMAWNISTSWNRLWLLALHAYTIWPFSLSLYFYVHAYMLRGERARVLSSVCSALLLCQCAYACVHVCMPMQTLLLVCGNTLASMCLCELVSVVLLYIHSKRFIRVLWTVVLSCISSSSNRFEKESG